MATQENRGVGEVTRQPAPWWWPDARGVIGIGVFVLVGAVLILLGVSDELRKDEFFKTIATLIVGAFIKDVVGWAYAATKGGGELAERNAAVVERHASTPAGTPADPVSVEEVKS